MTRTNGDYDVASVHEGRLWLAGHTSLLYLNEDLKWRSVPWWPVPWDNSRDFAFLSHESYIFVIGGSGIADNQVYGSDDGNDWTYAGHLNYALDSLHSHKAVSLAGSVWILGGEYLDWFYYEPEGDMLIPATFLLDYVLQAETSWSDARLLSAPWGGRSGLDALAYTDKLWIFGGRTAKTQPVEHQTEFEWLNDVWYAEITDSAEGEGEALDGEPLTWTEVTASAPWCPRSGHACVVFQDKVWLLGGYNGRRALNDVWTSDDGTNWVRVTDHAPWRGRSGHSAVIYQDKLWIIAGEDRTEALSDVWVYDPAAAEGEGEGEGEPLRYYHSADMDTDRTVNLSELLRVIQFFNSDGLHCEPCTEDDYNPGAGDQGCRHHDSDYIPSDWRIDLNELLRLIQLYNMGGYHPCETGEDGFCPGLE